MIEQWVPMNVAAKRLGITLNRISRWANKGLIQTRENPFDRRSRLVDIAEIQEKLDILGNMKYVDDGEEEAKEE